MSQSDQGQPTDESASNTSDATGDGQLPGLEDADVAGPTDDLQPEESVEGDTESRGIKAKLLSPLASLRGGNDSTAATPLSDISENLQRFISPEGISWNSTHTELGDLYSRTYTVASWPKEAQAHLLYELYTDPQLIYNASIHYDPYDRDEAIDHLAKTQNKLEDKANGEFAEYRPNVEAIQQTLDVIRDMKVQVENEGRKLYELSIYITVYAQEKDQLSQLDRRLRDQVTVSANLGLDIAREFPDEAHLSSSPLGKNAMANNREHATQLVLDKAAGLTFPLVDDTLVEPSGVIVGFNLANQTAVVLDIFNRNNGYNKLVIGDIGSGKSFGKGQYLVRHRIMHPEDNVIIIDPMGGFVGVNEAIGGEQITINGTETINPLELKETPEEVLEASDQDPFRMKLDEVRWFFQRFFETYNEDITSEMWAPLNRAIKKAYEDKGITHDPSTHSNPSPTVRDVLANLNHIAENPEDYASSTSDREIEKWETNAAELNLALEPFREGNELDNLVGETDFEIDDSTPTYVDMQAYDGKQESQGLMLRIVFSMLYEQVKDSDRRSIIAIDEAHKIIGSEESAEHWAELFRHSRHHDLSIQLISQEFEDFFRSEQGDGANEAAKTMANLCTIRQIHRVSNVDRPLAKEGLNLTDDHIDFIENAVPGEEGRGYTTALLDVEDKGYIGLKVTATQNELAVVDYDPEKTFDGDLATPESDRITKALRDRATLMGNTGKTQDNSQLEELVDSIPLENIAPEVVDLLIDRLIEDPNIEYSEEDRELLSKAITDSSGHLSEYAPEVAQADIDELAGRISVRAPITTSQDTSSREPSRPSSADSPTTGAPNPPWEASETEADEPPDGDSDRTTPGTEDGTSTDGIEKPAEQPQSDAEGIQEQASAKAHETNSPSSGPDESSEQPSTPSKPDASDTTDSHSSPESERQHASPEQTQASTTETQATQQPPDESTEDEVVLNTRSSREVGFHDRKEIHSEALEDLPDETIEKLAEARCEFSNGDPPPRSEIEDRLAKIHARQELEGEGPEATVEPTARIKDSLAAESASD
jgi:hypothetical protein